MRSTTAAVSRSAAPSPSQSLSSPPAVRPDPPARSSWPRADARSGTSESVGRSGGGRLGREGDAFRAGFLREIEDVHGLAEQHFLVAAENHDLLLGGVERGL